MPLKSGYSRKTFEANYQELRALGKPHEQALRICYDKARQSYFKRYPQGALPQWLAYQDGGRMKKTRHNNPSKNVAQAIANWCAKNKLPFADYERMAKMYNKNSTVWADRSFAELYKAAGTIKSTDTKRAKNPVPPAKSVQVRNAKQLYEDFTGHKATEKVSIDKPVMPDVLLAVGDVDGILYTTVRDGKLEKYIHKFAKRSRPTFAVSHDGKQLYMLGGSYNFTERGIEDR